MNSLFLIGNLTKSPEFITTPSGKSLAKIGLAINDPNDRNNTVYFDLCAWEAQAKAARNLEKGDTCAFTCKPKISSYTDRMQRDRQRLEPIVDTLTPFPSGVTLAGYQRATYIAAVSTAPIETSSGITFSAKFENMRGESQTVDCLATMDNVENARSLKIDDVICLEGQFRVKRANESGSSDMITLVIDQHGLRIPSKKRQTISVDLEDVFVPSDYAHASDVSMKNTGSQTTTLSKPNVQTNIEDEPWETPF